MREIVPYLSILLPTVLRRVGIDPILPTIVLLFSRWRIQSSPVSECILR